GRRRYRYALQPVAAAGEPVGAICCLECEQAKAKSDHDQGEMAEARDNEAHGETDESGCGRSEDEAGERLAPAKFGDQTCGVGADAEKRRVTERDDAGVAKDEVERKCEQRGDRDLTRKRQVVREQHEGQQRRQPEHDLQRMPAALRLEIGLGGEGCGGGGHIRSLVADPELTPCPASLPGLTWQSKMRRESKYLSWLRAG